MGNKPAAASTPELEEECRSAAEKGDIEALQALLDEGVVNINAPNEATGSTALHLAAWEDRDEAISLLLKHGASIDLPNNNQYTPLHCAALQGNPGSVRVLLAMNADVETTSWDGKTPEQLAASYADADVQQRLVQLFSWAPKGSKTLAEELRELKTSLEEGGMSQEQFDEAKEVVVGRMQSALG